MNTITEFIHKTWTSTRKTRVSPKNWIHGDAPCCIHNGETKDKRGRGGIKIDDSTGGFVWHCFNCGYKTGYRPGDRLFHKTRKLMSWMGASEADINRMAIEALRIRDLNQYIVAPAEREHHEVNFKERPLPKEALSFLEWLTFYELKGTADYPKGLLDAVEYAANRLGDLSKMPELYYTPNKEHAMNKRLIIPFTWKGKTVGYTARSFKKLIKPKYYTEVDSNYVFGMDRLIEDSEFVLVFEGPMDALLMNGVAILSNRISPEQADLIEGLNKRVIVVPDLEASGIPLAESAIDYGWDVSLPEWEEDIKDAGEAVQRYGKLFTLKTIISNVLSSELKIKLHMKRINKNVKYY